MHAGSDPDIEGSMITIATANVRSQRDHRQGLDISPGWLCMAQLSSTVTCADEHVMLGIGDKVGLVVSVVVVRKLDD